MLEYEQIKEELELYQKGREVRPLVQSPVWEVLKDTVRSYADNADSQLRRIPPGDPTIPTAHAVVYALDEFSTKFIEDIERAANFAANPSPEVVAYLTRALDDSDVAKAMGQPQ